MTEKQRQYAFDTEKEINQIPEGKFIKIYTSHTIIRIQHTRVNSAYRLLCVCKSDTRKTLRNKLLQLFREIMNDVTIK